MGGRQPQHNPRTLRGEQPSLQRAPISGTYRPVIEEAVRRRMGLTDFFLGLDAIRLASDASGPYEVQTISMVTSVMNKALEINQETFKSLDLCPEIVPLKVPLTDAAARLAIFAIDRQAAVDPIYFEAGYEILVRRTNNLLAATTELRLPTSE